MTGKIEKAGFTPTDGEQKQEHHNRNRYRGRSRRETPPRDATHPPPRDTETWLLGSLK